MKIENHILDILQLYEYAMAIGKSLKYKDNCDSFLKLILKRKNLNAAWILKVKENRFVSSYSLPKGKMIKAVRNEKIDDLLNAITNYKLIEANQFLPDYAPIDMENGQLAVFNLKDQGYLFLYSKQYNLNTSNISKLQPVIDKFYNSLLACKAFEDQKKLLKNLKLQNQELSDYAHMVSHDLKSPLRSIDTLTYFLKEDYANKIDTQGQKHMDTIRSNVEQMDGLINGILDYSTIGKTKTEHYDVDLNLLLKDILNIVKMPEHYNIHISELPTIHGDKYRLQQLFQNLISNAIKYNDKPEPKVVIKATKTKGHYLFSVTDNGIGIEKAYHERIFETFEKLQNDGRSTGIGLAIVKKIVRNYNGKIWLESEPGKGTTFYFTLKDQN